MPASAAAVAVLKCFALLLSISFLKDYTVDFQHARIANNFQFGDYEFKYIQLDSAILPRSLSFNYSAPSSLSLTLTDCITVKGQVGVSILGAITIPTPAEVSICGTAIFTAAGGDGGLAASCDAARYVPDMAACTLRANISVFGQSPTAVDLCELVDSFTMHTAPAAPAQATFAPLSTGATQTSDVAILQHVQAMLASWGTHGGVSLSTSFPDPTAVRVEIASADAMTVSPPAMLIRDVGALTSPIPRDLIVRGVEWVLLKVLGDDMARQIDVRLLVDQLSVAEGPLSLTVGVNATIPAGAALTVDVSVFDLVCDSDMAGLHLNSSSNSSSSSSSSSQHCVFPAEPGLLVGNIKLEGFAVLDFLAQGMAARVSHVLTNAARYILATVCSGGGPHDQCTFLSRRRTTTDSAATTASSIQLAPGATPVADVQMFRIAESALNGLAQPAGLSVHFEARDAVTERVTITLSRDTALTPVLELFRFDATEESVRMLLLPWITEDKTLAALDESTGGLGSQTLAHGIVLMTTQLEAQRAQLAAKQWVVRAGSVMGYLDVAFPSLFCDGVSVLNCTFPTHGALVPLTAGVHVESLGTYAVWLECLEPFADNFLSTVCAKTVASQSEEQSRCAVSDLLTPLMNVIGWLL